MSKHSLTTIASIEVDDEDRTLCGKKCGILQHINGIQSYPTCGATGKLLAAIRVKRVIRAQRSDHCKNNAK